MGSCLQSPDALQLVGTGICGNGVKEAGAGEECDCGPADSAACQNDICCDGATCKLKPGMKCDPLNDLCCTNTCMVKVIILLISRNRLKFVIKEIIFAIKPLLVREVTIPHVLLILLWLMELNVHLGQVYRLHVLQGNVPHVTSSVLELER
jgi:Disintegrin